MLERLLGDLFIPTSNHFLIQALSYKGKYNFTLKISLHYRSWLLGVLLLSMKSNLGLPIHKFGCLGRTGSVGLHCRKNTRFE